MASSYITAGSGIAGTYGETLAAGDFVRVGSDGKWYKAKADAASTIPCVGIATTPGSANAVGHILLNGISPVCTVFESDPLTTGGILYLSNETSGSCVQTRPTTNNSYVQRVGVALSSSLILFHPDLTDVKITA